MGKNYEKRLTDIREKLDKVSKKAAAVSGDIHAAFELGQEVLEDKLKDARGDAVAAQENLRLASEENRRHLSSQVLKAQMTLKAKAEDFRNAKDKRKLEKYIDNHVLYMADLYDTISYLLIEAELTAIETLAACQEYILRFGPENEEAEGEPEEGEGAEADAETPEEDDAEADAETPEEDDAETDTETPE